MLDQRLVSPCKAHAHSARSSRSSLHRLWFVVGRFWLIFSLRLEGLPIANINRVEASIKLLGRDRSRAALQQHQGWAAVIEECNDGDCARASLYFDAVGLLIELCLRGRYALLFPRHYCLLNIPRTRRCASSGTTG